MKKKLLFGILIGAVSALLACTLDGLRQLDTWEFNTWDLRVRFFKGESPATDKIRVILLDQASLDWGKNENALAWPWPRQVYAPILDFCRRGGAKVIAFDVLYTEPSAYDAYDDTALGTAIQATPGFVGAVFMGRASGDRDAWPEFVPSPPYVIQGLEQWLAGERPTRVESLRAAFPIPDLATNATLLGNVSDEPDKDGVFRRATLFKVFDGRAVASLGLAAYLAGEPDGGRQVPLSIEAGWLRVNNRRIPIDSEGRYILRFVGPSGSHRTFNAATIIQSEVRILSGETPALDPEVFRDCYVLFGFSAPGLLDLRPTPVSGVYPGVEIHATMLDNLLSQLFLRDAPPALVMIVIIAMALFSGVLGTLSRKAWQSVLTFFVCLPVPVVVGLAAYPAGYWWPIVAGTIAVALSLVGAVVVNYATEGRQKAFIKNAFRFYVGPEVIDQMISDPSKLKLGGEKKELTLFFSDLEKFSSFSEKLKPEELTALLNDYLSDMGEIIKEEGGYLDKYIGDAIVAFWNAPVPQPDHALRACRAALRCQRKLAERREEIAQRTGAVLKMRIGINTGEVTVGNMGSRERFNYTVLGDAANLASRLEGANKFFGTYTMISESAWGQASQGLVGREMGRIRVVGRATPVRVYEVVGLAGESVPEAVSGFEQAIKLCYAGAWRQALDLLERFPDDPLSAKYAAHCRTMLAEPSRKWEGVWTLTEKG